MAVPVAELLCDPVGFWVRRCQDGETAKIHHLFIAVALSRGFGADNRTAGPFAAVANLWQVAIVLDSHYVVPDWGLPPEKGTLLP